MAILNASGKPYKKTQEVATTAKDIDIFTGWATRLENPDTVLRTESGGKGLKLYDEIKRDAHAGSVLQTRYLSVVGKEWHIDAPDDSQKNQEIADYIKKVFLSCNFDQARQELMEAILYGYYTWEIMWNYSNGRVGIDKIIGKHPRRFIFTPERELRLLTPDSMIDGEKIPEKKFIVFTYGSSDNPYGSGLGQKLWWPLWFKKHGMKYWVMFAEKFGSPTVWGKYPAGTGEDEQNKLLEATESVQQESGIITPNTMEIELIEAARSSSINTYKDLCDFMDGQISKAVLGQTLTTDVGSSGSYAASQTHDGVRQDILKADADLLCELLNNTLIPWIVDFNFHGVQEYPKIWIRTEKEKDLKSLAFRDKILTKDIGVEVGKQYFYDTYGIPKPEKGEDVIQPPVSNRPNNKPTFAEHEFAEPNDQELLSKVDTLISDAVEDAAPLFEDLTERIKAEIETANSLEELAKKLPELYKTMPSEPLAKHLSKSIMKADGIGIDSVKQESNFAEGIWGDGLPFEEAVDFFKARAFTVAGVTKADVLGEVKDEITKAMETGLTFKEFKNSAADIFNNHGYSNINSRRIETIYRTNMQSAYQAGRYRQMTDPAVMAARPYWRYVAVQDSSARPEHLEMHGKIFPAGDPIWDTWFPPNGFNCRCTIQTLSAREVERNGWKVETKDPTGKMFKPADKETRESFPTMQLLPDRGWGERSGSLEKLMKEKSFDGVTWKEAVGQLGPEALGRPLEKDIADTFWKAGPEKSTALEELITREKQSKSDAIKAIERQYKAVMGISPVESSGVLKGADGEVMKVNLDGLAHAMLDRKSKRERYIPYLRQVIENPYEILMTEYKTSAGKTKYRKKYLGLFREAKKNSVVITAEVSPEGWTMWNVMNVKKGTIDRQRQAVSLLYGQ